MKQASTPMLRLRQYCAAALFACAAVFAVNTAHAQAADDAAATATTASIDTSVVTATAEPAEPVETAADADKSLLDLFKAGGWTMYPLTALSILGFALIIYNALAIRADRFLVPSVTPEVDEALRSLDIEGARRVCEEHPAAITNIINSGLARTDIRDFHADAIKEAIEETATAELSDPFVPINYLSMVGTLSPMVGLLGTVTGMIKGFAAIAGEGMGNPQLLADAISECLITTAVGMIIAIPAMFFYYYFKNRYGKITSQISRIVGDMVFNLGKSVRERGASGRAA